MGHISVSIHDLDGKVLFSLEVLDGASSLAGLCLVGAVLMGAELHRANLRNADLYWAMMDECDLRGACLTGASLRGATLYRANFVGADLRGADFSQDNLGGATELNGCDFSDADVSGAVWYGAVFDGDTVFPKGFDPIEHEMYCPHEVCGRADHRGYREWANSRIKRWPIRFQQAR